MRVGFPGAHFLDPGCDVGVGDVAAGLLNQIKAGAHGLSATNKKSHNFGLALPVHLAERHGSWPPLSVQVTSAFLG